jgi:hypothetical protein
MVFVIIPSISVNVVLRIIKVAHIGAFTNASVSAIQVVRLLLLLTLDLCVAIRVRVRIGTCGEHT